MENLLTEAKLSTPYDVATCDTDQHANDLKVLEALYGNRRWKCLSGKGCIVSKRKVDLALKEFICKECKGNELQMHQLSLIHRIKMIKIENRANSVPLLTKHEPGSVVINCMIIFVLFIIANTCLTRS